MLYNTPPWNRRPETHTHTHTNLEYKFSQPFEPAEMEQLFKVATPLSYPPIDTPLSLPIVGIAGQTNILFDPPFHVGHDNAIH